MAEKKGIPLTSVAGFPANVAAKLAELWITTAEELAGAAVQEDGLAGLAGFTGLDEAEMTRLVELAQAALPPSVSFAPGDIDRHGLGALDEPPTEPPGEEPARFAPLPPAVDLHGRDAIDLLQERFEVVLHLQARHVRRLRRPDGVGHDREGCDVEALNGRVLDIER